MLQTGMRGRVGEGVLVSAPAHVSPRRLQPCALPRCSLTGAGGWSIAERQACGVPALHQAARSAAPAPHTLPSESGAAPAPTTATQSPGCAGTQAEDSGERLVSAGSWREAEALLLGKHARAVSENIARSQLHK